MLRYAGVMEWWSDGVMIMQVEFRLWLFSILQYSSTPKAFVIFTGKAVETRLGPEYQVS
jgi:hypothetical protein